MKLFCLLGIHYKVFKSETVFKGKNSETSNCWEECKYCGWKGEESGFTNFGPFEVRLK